MIQCFSFTAVPLLGAQERLAPVPQLSELRANIAEFGFLCPILLNRRRQVVAGCEQLLAACSMGLKAVPCVISESLRPEEARRIRDCLASQLVRPWDECDDLSDEILVG